MADLRTPKTSNESRRNARTPEKRSRLPIVIAAAVVVLVAVVLIVRVVISRNTPQSFVADTADFGTASLSLEENADAPAEEAPAVEDTALPEEGPAESDTPSAPEDAALGEFGAEADDDSFSWESSEEEASATSADENAVAVKYAGGVITAGDIIPVYNSRLSAYGFGEEVEDTSALLQEVLTSALTDRVVREKAEALGLTQLTSDEKARLRSEAEELYSDQVNELAQAGVDDPEATLASVDVSVDILEQQLTDDLWRARLSDYAAASVTISDADLKAAYDALLSEQQGLFAADPASFTAAANAGELIVFIPDGCRLVKDIYLPFTDAAKAARAQAIFDAEAVLDPGNDIDQLMAYNDELRELYAELDTASDAVIRRLNSGESFESLMAELNPADMTGTVSNGAGTYYVCPDTVGLWSDEFVEAAQNLEHPGEYTAVSARSPGGVHIILYTQDTVAGAVPFESVRDALEKQLRAERSDSAVDALTEQWVSEAAPEYHPEVIR